MLNRLLFFIPEEAWIYFLIIAGLMMILGLRKAALKLVVSIILLALFSPFLDALIKAIPAWMLGLLFIGFIFSMIRLLLGKRVADNVISFLIYDLIRAPFRIVGFLFTRGGR
jgi:hypothetical protein